ncbi:hypothetical protein IE81DRAFT_325658 [Ceraceosorus guamensis]|uniref:Large ribosomal subunit protein bL21m n=1 Tax=Ceraceosorus guamensis TaxID=1522189 RepID=A0A316VVM1_9BASI|nr:hypothetical protein IE81DRAFT_325658 [Ceraceosorus guamensis]PWN40361.1 hypothetical protein IE81DRAFT_325658 [Ceraceosorus guamensis]
MSASRVGSLLLPRAGSASASASASASVNAGAVRSFCHSPSVARPASASAPASTASTSNASSYVPVSPSSYALSASTADASSITSTRSALSLLRTQPSHYAVLSLVGRTLLVRPGDIITLPRLLDVQVGDVMRLERVHELGSRDFTLRAQDPLNTRSRGEAVLSRRSRPFEGLQQGSQAVPMDANQAAVPAQGAELYPGNLSLEDITTPTLGAGADETNVHAANRSRLVQSKTSWAARLLPAGLAHVGATLSPSTIQIRGVVLEHTKGALEKIVKFKKRKGYKKTVQHKQTLTRIRVEEFRLGEGEGE